MCPKGVNKMCCGRPLDYLEHPPYEYTLAIISGKWKTRIIGNLKEFKTIRYNDLRRKMTPITQKMLTCQLKELEKDGIIQRREYNSANPKVEYSLSQKGLDLWPILESMCLFSRKYNDEQTHIQRVKEVM